MSEQIVEPIRLENWAFGVRDESPYTPPECQIKCLRGNQYGHPQFADGDHITTSEIMAI